MRGLMSRSQTLGFPPNLEPKTVGVGSAHLAPPGEPLLGGAGGVLREISRRRRSVSVRHGTAGAGG